VWDTNHLYIDPERKLYEFIETKKGSNWDLMSFSMMNKIRKALKFGNANDGMDVGNILGGGFLVDVEGNVTFKYLQDSYGNHASEEDIKNAVSALSSNGAKDQTAPSA